MRYNFYFCNVKSQVRQEVAAMVQRFLCHIYIVNSKRIVWGNSNVPKASALESLTARNALFILSKLIEL